MQNLTHDTNELNYEKDTDSGTERTEEEVWQGCGLELWDQQMQTIIYRMDKQQGPTVQHRELYSISCDKPEWKRI